MWTYIAIFGLFLCTLTAFAMGLHAAARVTRFQKSTKDIDWESVSDLIGDVASLKSQLRKVNNRFNGFERAGKGTALDAQAEAERFANMQVVGQNRYRGG